MTGIKLEAGKTYLDRKGNKHGPLVHDATKIGTLYEYSLGNGGLSLAWRADGRVYNTDKNPRDLIEEVVEAPTTMRDSPNYKHEVRRPADYNDGTIHGWNGGDCPVHPETVVKYWTNSGEKYPFKANCLRWKHTDEGLGDIIAFRVVKEYVEPARPAASKVIWVNEYNSGNAVYSSEETARKKAGTAANRIAVKYVEAIADAKEAQK